MALCLVHTLWASMIWLCRGQSRLLANHVLQACGRHLWFVRQWDTAAAHVAVMGSKARPPPVQHCTLHAALPCASITPKLPRVGEKVFSATACSTLGAAAAAAALRASAAALGKLRSQIGICGLSPEPLRLLLALLLLELSPVFRPSPAALSAQLLLLLLQDAAMRALLRQAPSPAARHVLLLLPLLLPLPAAARLRGRVLLLRAAASCNDGPACSTPCQVSKGCNNVPSASFPLQLSKARGHRARSSQQLASASLSGHIKSAGLRHVPVASIEALEHHGPVSCGHTLC